MRLRAINTFFIWLLDNEKVTNPPKIKKRKMHNLRHTFGVMEWFRTGDIYLVCKKLGHSSVTTTEIYTKFELSELRKDFPIESSRLDGNGQVLMGSHPIEYIYGKA